MINRREIIIGAIATTNVVIASPALALILSERPIDLVWKQIKTNLEGWFKKNSCPEIRQKIVFELNRQLVFTIFRYYQHVILIPILSPH